MAILFRCLIALVAVASVIADNCPTYPGTKTGCSEGTCGHFAVKGKFRSTNSKGHTQLQEITASSIADCCNSCRNTTGCIFYNFFTSSSTCRLMNFYTCDYSPVYNESLPTNYNPSYNAGFNITDIRYYSRYPLSYTGGRCNAAQVINDPHLVGARGTPFDFNGLPDKTFCLVTDKNLHINMQLSGYYDKRTEGATAFTKDGLAIRTWIKVLSIMWKSHGEEHSIVLVSRKGAQQERGDGFMDSILVDGAQVPRLALGDELNLYNGQASITFEAYEKVGPYDVDLYKLRIEGLLVAEIRLRVAHPLLQRPDDAEVHISMDILDMAYTPSVHGVLGQTYRADHEDRALNYTALATLMNAPVSADMESGKGFLDGNPLDYTSSALLVPDCKYSQYTVGKVLGAEKFLSEEEVSERPLRSARTSVVSEVATVATS